MADVRSLVPILRRALGLGRGPAGLMPWLGRQMSFWQESNALGFEALVERLTVELTNGSRARHLVQADDWRYATLENVARETIADIPFLINDHATRSKPKVSVAPKPKQFRETILVTEDEPSVRQLVRYVLARQGFYVLEAKHGKEAVGIGNGYPGPIALLVTDMVMPELNGAQVAAQLATSRPEMKVLFLSGSIDVVANDPERNLSGSAFLPKPFTPSILVKKVNELLCEIALTTSFGTGVDDVNHLPES